MQITDIVPEEGAGEARALIEILRAGKTVKPVNLKRLTKDGRSIDVRVSSTALRDDSGEIVAIATTEQVIG